MTSTVINAASEWLVRLRDERVTPDDHAAFQAWLAEDPAHDEAFFLLSNAVGDVETLATQLDGAPEIAALRRRRDTLYRPSRRGVMAFGALAAAFALFAIVGTSMVALGPQTYTTRVGEQRTIALTDGSRIQLNTDTQVSVHYSDRVREIVLTRGEAAFEVAHNPNRPFIVEAEGQAVRAVGTQFIVHVKPEALSVLVVEGIVAVTPVPAHAANAPAALPIAPPSASTPRLVAGQHFELEGLGNTAPVVTTLASADIERNLAWRTGMLEFDGEHLSAAVDEVGRYTGAHFTLDASVRDTPVWAYFKAADLDSFLTNLERNIPTLRVQRTGNEVRIAARAQASGANVPQQ